VTVTEGSAPGNLRLAAGGQAMPLASSINYGVGQTRANNLVVGVGDFGELAIRADQSSGSVQVILDVNGYFE
jgi:hypothetical protein